MAASASASPVGVSDPSIRSGSHRFQILLGSLLGLLLLYPAAQAVVFGEVLIHAISALVLLAGVYSVAGHPAVRGGAAALAVLAVASDLAVMTGAGDAVLVASLAAEAAFELLIDIAVLRAVIVASRVDADILAGGLCAYLLTGMAFASVFSIVEVLAPGACSFPDPAPASPRWADFVFFSFTTLTTLGYGDVRPVSDLARSLTSTEAILGVFYMAILVSRLVSLYGDQPVAQSREVSAPTTSDSAR